MTTPDTSLNGVYEALCKLDGDDVALTAARFALMPFEGDVIGKVDLVLNDGTRLTVTRPGLPHCEHEEENDDDAA